MSEDNVQDEFSAGFAEAASAMGHPEEAAEVPSQASDDAPAAGAVDASVEVPTEGSPGAPAVEEPAPAARTYSEQEIGQLLERELHKAKSDIGRTYAEKLRGVEKQLEEMRAQTAATQAAVAPDDSGFDDVDKAEIAQFRKDKPELAKNTIDGPQGKLWKKALLDKGAPEVELLHLAAVQAASQATAPVAERVAQSEQRFQTQQADRAVMEHFGSIEQAHPGYVQLLANPAPRGDGSTADKYHPELVAWVDALPMREGVPIVQALEHGTPSQVIEAVGKYKSYLAAKQAQATSQPQPAAAAAPPVRIAPGAMAVPQSRGTPPPRPEASKDDFAAGWAEATAGR